MEMLICHYTKLIPWHVLITDYVSNDSSGYIF
jgi:hypothetical protein